MPASTTEHDGYWVYFMVADAFFNKPELGCTAHHNAGSRRDGASLSVKVRLPPAARSSGVGVELMLPVLRVIMYTLAAA